MEALAAARFLAAVQFPPASLSEWATAVLQVLTVLG